MVVILTAFVAAALVAFVVNELWSLDGELSRDGCRGLRCSGESWMIRSVSSSDESWSFCLFSPFVTLEESNWPLVLTAIIHYKIEKRVTEENLWLRS